MRTVVTLCAAALTLMAVALPASARTGTITTLLNLREGPGVNHAPIVAIPGGASVKVLSCERTWCRIAWRSYDGYVSRSYISYASPKSAKAQGTISKRAQRTSAPSRSRTARAETIVIVPPPVAPPGPVVYSAPFPDGPVHYQYRSFGAGFFIGL